MAYTVTGFIQTSVNIRETQLHFGFLKDLGLEKPDFLPDFGSKNDEQEDITFENGINVGDTFPKDALKKFGVNGKKAVVYFYGADDAPSCKKQNAAFDARLSEFKKLGATVVGVRNENGVKESVEAVSQDLIVDENDEIRNLIGIKKDLGLLGGRETFVIGKNGKIEYKFNAQFKPEAHVDNTLDFLSN
eukprot:CAMPEP_0194135856 /NCGR_PEP_ID=MMETSP0152-20130528/5928_1 /TAXON_ID=1049557 /ORGANISM="Thalassiothrix antarctica, Strain L6-D1" /LENGTH=188 /DNA_ID=CAMNT_0038832277 /DNA_START=65 /DNA_END=631 /DNA_ORIENTATION=-